MHNQRFFPISVFIQGNLSFLKQFKDNKISRGQSCNSGIISTKFTITSYCIIFIEKSSVVSFNCLFFVWLIEKIQLFDSTFDLVLTDFCFLFDFSLKRSLIEVNLQIRTEIFTDQQSFVCLTENNQQGFGKLNFTFSIGSAISVVCVLICHQEMKDVI